jgi:predicted 3-demethylubiquinone-9 3-methyltransferase (glyoxalase superfamily)
MNNILQLAAPLAANEALQNHTFNINYQKKGFLKMYNFEINQIHFITVDGFDIKDFSFKNGTDTVVLTVGNVNIDATIDGMASCLWLIKGHFEAFTIKNLTIKIEISIDS